MNGTLLGSKLGSELISAVELPLWFNGRTKRKLLRIFTGATGTETRPTKGDFRPSFSPASHPREAALS